MLIRLLAKMVRKYRERYLCKCAEPRYAVKAGILCCDACNKPVKWERTQAKEEEHHG